MALEQILSWATLAPPDALANSTACKIRLMLGAIPLTAEEGTDSRGEFCLSLLHS